MDFGGDSPDSYKGTPLRIFLGRIPIRPYTFFFGVFRYALTVFWGGGRIPIRPYSGFLGRLPTLLHFFQDDNDGVVFFHIAVKIDGAFQ